MAPFQLLKITLVAFFLLFSYNYILLVAPSKCIWNSTIFKHLHHSHSFQLSLTLVSILTTNAQLVFRFLMSNLIVERESHSGFFKAYAQSCLSSQNSPILFFILITVNQVLKSQNLKRWSLCPFAFISSLLRHRQKCTSWLEELS